MVLSLAAGQYYHCPGASEVTQKDMDTIYYSRNKTNNDKARTTNIFLGIYSTSIPIHSWPQSPHLHLSLELYRAVIDSPANTCILIEVAVVALMELTPQTLNPTFKIRCWISAFVKTCLSYTSSEQMPLLTHAALITLLDASNYTRLKTTSVIAYYLSIHESHICDVPHIVRIFPETGGPRLNIKTVLSTYGDFHVKDKTAVRTSYL